jgi:hypothetical protein
MAGGRSDRPTAAWATGLASSSSRCVLSLRREATGGPSQSKWPYLSTFRLVMVCQMRCGRVARGHAPFKVKEMESICNFVCGVFSSSAGWMRTSGVHGVDQRGLLRAQSDVRKMFEHPPRKMASDRFDVAATMRTDVPSCTLCARHGAEGVYRCEPAPVREATPNGGAAGHADTNAPHADGKSANANASTAGRTLSV